MEHPGYSEQPPYFAVVRHGVTVVAAALMTPPHNLVLARIQASAALELIADDVRAFSPPRGVLGAKDDSLTFARIWRERTRQPYRLGMAERIYELDRVIPPHGIVPGRLREATEADRGLLIDWFHAFSRETMHDDDRAGSERSVDLRLRSAATIDFFWEDRQPVSFTGVFRGTPNGARVGPVYTPPEHRGHGYASACVAAASQRMLDEGCRFCFLFTDLSNPTSNHIYQEIGYRPVVDVDEYRFG
jgi:GNAT superfamily N-acetyltransferase